MLHKFKVGDKVSVKENFYIHSSNRTIDRSNILTIVKLREFGCYDICDEHKTKYKFIHPSRLKKYVPDFENSNFEEWYED